MRAGSRRSSIDRPINIDGVAPICAVGRARGCIAKRQPQTKTLRHSERVECAGSRKAISDTYVWPGNVSMGTRTSTSARRLAGVWDGGNSHQLVMPAVLFYLTPWFYGRYNTVRPYECPLATI
eukprot:scaffold124003_cov26-Prasinocladus_malaysianus.AAC.1